MHFRDFQCELGVRLDFCCAHVPCGNGIMEQCHQSMKQIAAKKLCPIIEAVYWYNVTLKDNVSPLTDPANLIHCYRVRLKGINALPPDETKQLHIGYDVGDHVWLKTPNGLCTLPYACGRITGMISPQNFLVNEMPHHVETFILSWVQILWRVGVTTNSQPKVREWSSTIHAVIPWRWTKSDARDDTSADESSEEEVALPQKNPRHKRPTPGCHHIMRESSRIERQKSSQVVWWTNQSLPFKETMSRMLYMQEKQQM